MRRRLACIRCCASVRAQCMDEREPGNLYERLGVSRSATPEAIRKAFRRYALAHHPDKAPPERRERATRDFQSVQQAYDVLSDGAVRTHTHFYRSLNCLLVLRPRGRRRPPDRMRRGCRDAPCLVLFQALAPVCQPTLQTPCCSPRPSPCVPRRETRMIIGRV